VRVRCGKGTYIRTLAADLGTVLSCGAALAGLVRTRVGPYALADAMPWTDVRDARHGERVWPRVRPSDSALQSFPPVWLDARSTERFCHGQTVPAPGVPDGLARVY